MFTKLVIFPVFFLLPLASLSNFGFGLEVVHQKKLNSFQKRVSVWFDPAVRQYGPEPRNAISKTELEIMVQLISTQFRTIVLPPVPHSQQPPGAEAHSLVWIPSVVAAHNRKETSSFSGYKPVELILTTELVVHPHRSGGNNNSTTEGQGLLLLQLQQLISSANSTFPGTVSTVLLTTSHAKFFQEQDHQSAPATKMMDQVGQVRREVGGGGGVKVGLQTELRACVKNLEENSAINWTVGRVVPNLDLIVLRATLSPTKFGLEVEGRQVVRIFGSEFAECEKGLKRVNPEIVVLPLILCHNERAGLEPKWLLECWRLVRQWGEEEQGVPREIMMYSAFDAPEGNYDHPRGEVEGARVAGWWRLRSPEERNIFSESAFVEKISEQAKEEEVEEEKPRRAARRVTREAAASDDEFEENIPHRSEKRSSSREESARRMELEYWNQVEVPVGIALLSVICASLLLVDVGLFYIFVCTRKEWSGGGGGGGGGGGDNDGSSHYRFSTVDDRFH